MQSDHFAIKRISPKLGTAVEARSQRSFARHTHDEFGIGFIHAGAQRSWSGRGIVDATAGDIITVNPGEVHDGRPIGGSRSWSMLYIEPSKLASITLDISEGREGSLEFYNPVVRDANVARKFRYTYAAIAGDNNEAASEQMFLLLASFLRNVPVARPDNSSAVKRIRARIDDDPAGFHPLAELAQCIGATKFQTIRAFSRVTGLTPHAYILQKRLDLAKNLVRNGSKLADAAFASGFSDQSHFHNMFKRRFGITPGAFAAAMI